MSQKVISVPLESGVNKLISTLFPTRLRSGEGFDELLADGRLHVDAGRTKHEDICIEIGLTVPENEDVKALIEWIEGYARRDVSNHLHHLLNRLIEKIVGEGDIGEFQEEWNRLLGGGTVDSAIDSYRMEFSGLVDSPRPNEVENESGRGYIFWMEDEQTTGIFGNLRIKAEPIQKLRTVTALTGYTRGAVGDLEANALPNPVDVSHHIHGDDWYAANEAYGEGVLLTLDVETPHPERHQRWADWESSHNNICEDALREAPSQRVPWTLFRSARTAASTDPDWRPSQQKSPEFFAESHPLFVWWHTFSHHLIRAIQAETGYSSAAIAERIYAVPERDGSWRGALVLYVTDGGMEGTLGGLTSLLPNLQIFLNRVLTEGHICSNDPLCEEAPSRLLPDIGCYACTLNPETSCEHRNMFLDRLLLFEGAGI